MSREQQPENKNLAYYCKRFSELNVSNSSKKGNANYKPILLLSVIDIIAQGFITENCIPISDNLINTFNSYWNLLGSPAYKGGLHYPFFHLQSEGFWHLEFNPEDKLRLQPKTTNKLKESVQYAYFDDELFDLLQEQNSRQEIIDTIVASWFSANRKEIEDILKVNQNLQNYTSDELENLDAQPKVVLRKSVVRNAFFRKAVVHIYDYRCVFCRLKVMRKIAQNIVDGAHIKPFSQFYDSRINNGISLCKNHHWAFDQGWFAIDDNYQIIVASDLEEESPHGKLMKNFHGEVILLPDLEQYLPRLDALQWHRTNVFRA